MSRPLYMRHNFPAVEALEAGGVSLEAMVRVAPAVDPEHLLIREARPWFERIVLRTTAAIALPYVVYVRADVYRRRRAELTDLVIHEVIHVHQWRTEGYIRFAVIYAGDYLKQRLRGASHRDAYRAIRYETEARRLTEAVRSG